VSEVLKALNLQGPQVTALLLVLARLSPLFAIAPLFGSRLLPGRARALCAVGLAVGLAPVVAPHPHEPASVLALALSMASEVLVGLAFAFIVAAVFAGVSAAGSLLDGLIGFSFGSLVDPTTGTQASVLSNLYGMVAVMVFIAIGGDAWLLQGLVRTYAIVPLGRMPSIAAMAAGAEHAVGTLFLAAIEVAAPVLLALVLTDAALGVVARAVPQLNVFAVGFPAKIVVGLLVLVAALPFVGGWIGDQVQTSVASALGALKVS
jgi:flagellar biosynthesis protein FliR